MNENCYASLLNLWKDYFLTKLRDSRFITKVSAFMRLFVSQYNYVNAI